MQDMVKRNEAETRGQRETALAAASAAAAAEALQQEQAAQLAATGGAGTALDDLAVLPRQLPDLGVVHQQEQNEQRQLPTDLDAIKQQEEKSAAQLLAERVVDGSTVSEVADSEHR